MLVGRQAEQQAIDRLVSAARLGTSGVLAVCGEAGVGKTALLDDAVSRMAGMRVLRGTGLESEHEIPFAMLLQLLRPALGALDGIPPIQADALTAALALPDASGPVDGRDRFTIGAAVLSLLCRFAEDGPVAVTVDDLHLADAASANSLVFAARRLAADPVVMLLGVRSPEGDAAVAGLPALRLEGIDLDSARTLVSDSGRAASEEQVRMLHRATAGNPLALLELRAADLDVTESVQTGLPLRVPRAVADAFGRRLADLDAQCRSALLVAAVCGTDLRLVSDACALLGVDVALLGEAEDLGLVTVGGGRVEFRHPLLRAAVYSGATAAERHAAHRAAADATPSSDVDRRAWHLSEATWHPDEEVAGLLAVAGEHAVARAAYSVASGAFERSARLTPDTIVRRARLLRAADAAWTAGGGERALALLDEREREATALEAGSAEASEIELRASIAARSGSLRAAVDLLVAAVDRADGDGRADHAADDGIGGVAGRADADTIALADAVHATFYLGDGRTAAALADRLEVLRPNVRSPRARALGLMATGMGRTLAGRGGADEIRAAVPLLESDPELRHDPRRLSWLLLAPLFLRDAASGDRLRALVDEVRGAAGIGALPAVLFHVAVDQATTGASWARAQANFVEAIRLGSETGQDTELAMSLAGLTRLDSRAGRVEDCLEHGERARGLCTEREIHVGEAWVAHALGDLELSLGHAELATERFDELVALLDRLGLDDVDLAPGPELTDALVRLRRHEDASAAAEAYRGRARRKGQPWALARADRARGLAADDDGFAGWFESALDMHGQTLDQFEEARTRLSYGSRLRRVGRRVEARVQLRPALDSFSELGATVWRDLTAAELTATGAHVRPAGADVLGDLTPQELQVSVLLAEGRTTRDAAAALFLSPKTVEYHLRKVYTKLGIASRTELAEVLARHGR